MRLSLAKESGAQEGKLGSSWNLGNSAGTIDEDK